MTFWISLAISKLRAENYGCHMYKIRSPSNPNFDLSHDHKSAPSFLTYGHLEQDLVTLIAKH